MFKGLLAILVISLSASAGEPVKPGDEIKANKFNNSTFTIGDVKTSLLSESSFQTLHGDCWVKMTGQNISGSDLATLEPSLATLPDASGRFLRNLGGNSNSLAQTQEDAFQGHKHHAQASGDGLYLYIRGSGGVFSGLSGGNHLDRGSEPIGNPRTDGVNGTPRTANETRPQNLTVNMFIKLNHNCN